jgi:hypothetical protein
MIEIKIKESSDNRVSEPNKKVNLKIVGTGVNSSITTTWSFISVTNPSANQILHSIDGEEGVYLNYPDDQEPTMQISLPETGNYVIKGVARVEIPNEENVTHIYLDDSGNRVTNTALGIITTTKYVESANLSLNYSIEGWS